MDRYWEDMLISLFCIVEDEVDSIVARWSLVYSVSLGSLSPSWELCFDIDRSIFRHVRCLIIPSRFIKRGGKVDYPYIELKQSQC